MKTEAFLTVRVLASAIQAQQANTQTPEQQHAAMMKRGDADGIFTRQHNAPFPLAEAWRGDPRQRE